MTKLIYNKNTKTFSDGSISKKEFIDKYCKVLPGKNDFMPDKPWIIVVMDDCYLTSGVSVEKILEDKDQIDFLIMHGITQVESTFTKDEYREHPVANIGYNPEEQKWYGWSHRAWHDFGIGDTPKEFYPDKTVEGKPIETIEEAKIAASKFAESVA
jgi:hypothetical protein